MVVHHGTAGCAGLDAQAAAQASKDVAASFEQGTSSLGLANSITAPLAQGKDAIVKLDDTTGQGDGFRLAGIHCL